MSDDIICELCGILVNRNKYNWHLKFGHKKKKEHFCVNCNKTFTSLYNLNYHLAHHHSDERNFLCNECPRNYKTLADLAQHQRVHEKQRGEPFKCEECNLLFPFRSRFKTHMLRIHKKGNKDPKECQICYKKFISLSNHKRIVHMNLRNYQCKICLKTFGKRSGLNRHVLTVHEKQRNFNCNLCNKAFGEKGQLTKHIKTHSVVKDITFCSICKENFKDIKEHYEIKHEDRKHTCEICFKKFKKSTQLKIHIKTFHGSFTSFFCDFCEKGFDEKFQLRRHMKIHILKGDCENDQLEQIFLKEEFEEVIENYLKIKDDHIDDRRKKQFNVNDKVIKCNLCVKMFKSKKRLQEHFDDIHFLINDKIEEIIEQNETARKEENLMIFQCDQCEKSFNKMQHLKNHYLASHSDENYFKCKDCKRSFSYKSALDRHFKIVHQNQKNYVCNECGLKFASNFDLNQHYEGHHNEATIAQRTCGFCDKIFKKEINLKIHIQAIHKNTKFECKICQKSFSFKSAKERHLKVVHYNQKLHKCRVCEKSFGTLYDLKNHFNHYHNDDDKSRKYHCEECDKYFLSSSALSRHQKGVHEHVKIKSEIIHKCKICHEIFGNKYQKDKHAAQVHMDGKKLTRTCKLCKLEFQFYDEYKNHIESHADIFICITCGDYFKDQESLFTHSERHKKIEIQLRKFTCDFCDHRLFNKIQLIVHMRKHMQEKNFYVCEICGQSYKFIAPFLYHKKLHEASKEFICSYCSKGFVRKQDLIIHYRHHTNDKSFKCQFCSKNFSQKQVLANHLEKHSTKLVSFNCSEIS